MLLRKLFAIECVEGWHFKSERVLDCVPLDWIGSSSSGFLPNSGALEGSDLLLKSLHPMTSITIGSLTLRLYFALAVGLNLRLDFVSAIAFKALEAFVGFGILRETTNKG